MTTPSPRPRSPFPFIAILAMLLALAVALAAGNAEGTTLGFANWDVARAGYLTVLLVFVGSALFGRGLGASEIVRAAAAWLAILLVLVGAYAYRSELTAVGARVVGALLPGLPIEGKLAGEPDGTVVINRGIDGNFAVRAEVDSRRMLLMVDTGASFVTLTSRDAATIGVDMGSLHFDTPIRTANGIIQAAPITIAHLAVGSVERNNVSALVAPVHSLDQSLLGLSFLDTLGGYAISGDRLVLTP